jgi:hypothetical protein
MEMLTLSTLQYLNTTVLFVVSFIQIPLCLLSPFLRWPSRASLAPRCCSLFLWALSLFRSHSGTLAAFRSLTLQLSRAVTRSFTLLPSFLSLLLSLFPISPVQTQVDLTEECGTSVEDQWAIRQEMLARFPNKPWIDIFSKEDSIEGILADGREIRQARELAAAAAGTAAGSASPSGGVVSAEAGGGAKVEVEKEEEVPYPRASQLIEASVSEVVRGPEEFVAAVPGAMCVSALTEDGMPELKERIMSVLSSYYRHHDEGWAEDYGEEGGAEEGGMLAGGVYDFGDDGEEEGAVTEVVVAGQLREEAAGGAAGGGGPAVLL